MKPTCVLHIYNTDIKEEMWDRETTAQWWLRILALAEDQGSVPSPHMMAQNHLVPGDSSDFLGHWSSK